MRTFNDRNKEEQISFKSFDLSCTSRVTKFFLLSGIKFKVRLQEKKISSFTVK